MDGHKMIWHLDRVYEWLKTGRTVPIHIDVGLSKGCNIRCEYCYGATQGNLYQKQKGITFPKEPLLRYFRDAGKAGVRSMAIIGEAEPTLNPYLYDAIIEGKKAGVDIALGTNGILFDDAKKGEGALENLTWIRFNISAYNDEGYKKIHRSKDFNIVIKKIKFCVNTKQKKNLNVTIGLQMVLTPNNVDQVIGLAQLGKEIGVDYLVIKQCSDTRHNDIGVFEKLDIYHTYEHILKEAETYSDNNYKVIVKWYKINNEGRRSYDTCLGVPFLLYSSGDGKLFPCGMFFEYRRDEFLMGDLLKQSFIEIIESDRYWEVIERVKELDVHKVCYANCRTNEINEFLWQIKHPPEHVNFV
jgi:MoaA/NifB/PqqE/SkfB family radical SAM enzyme